MNVYVRLNVMSNGIQEVSHLACVKNHWFVCYFSLVFLAYLHVTMHIENRKRQCLLFGVLLIRIIRNQMTLKIIFRYEKRKNEIDEY
jgi:hypothetical protein